MHFQTSGMRNVKLVFLSVVCLNACAPQEQKGLSDKQLMAVTCRYMSEGQFYKSENEEENMQRRTLLYHCVDKGFLNAQKTAPAPIDTVYESAVNRLGIDLERRNIWYYSEDDAGKQSVGLNLYNSSNTAVSWITVGFYPSSCKIAEKPPFVLFLPLANPLLRKDQTVLTWDMPSDLRIENGCLDILAAGDDSLLSKGSHVEGRKTGQNVYQGDI